MTLTLIQAAFVALIFCLAFAGIILLGQHNVACARLTHPFKVAHMEVLLARAKLGGLMCCGVLLAVFAIASLEITAHCVTLAFGLTCISQARRLAEYQFEQALLRNFIPVLFVACTGTQMLLGPMQPPKMLLVDVVVLAMVCRFIARDKAALDQARAIPL